MRSKSQTRTRRRLFAHHLPLFVGSLLSVVALYFTRPYRDALSRASFATAYPALFLLTATLMIGPWNVIRKKRNPVSSDVRRDIGIWAAIMGVLHSAIGQNVHLRGRPWLYYVYEKRGLHIVPLRHDLFGLANYAGAISVLIMIALLASSNDYCLRALGTPQWKRLQRWNYASFTLAAAHSLGYLVAEKNNPSFMTSVIICVAITLALQTAGLVRRKAAAANTR